MPDFPAPHVVLRREKRRPNGPQDVCALRARRRNRVFSARNIRPMPPPPSSRSSVYAEPRVSGAGRGDAVCLRALSSTSRRIRFAGGLIARLTPALSRSVRTCCVPGGNTSVAVLEVRHSLDRSRRSNLALRVRIADGVVGFGLLDRLIRVICRVAKRRPERPLSQRSRRLACQHRAYHAPAPRALVLDAHHLPVTKIYVGPRSIHPLLRSAKRCNRPVNVVRWTPAHPYLRRGHANADSAS